MSEVQGPVIASIGKVQKQEFNMPKGENNANNGDTLTPEQQAYLDKGLNKDGTEKAAAGTELTAEQKQANVAAGKNEDGSEKNVELSAEQKAANIAAGLNEDGTSKAGAETGKPLTDEELKAEYEKRFPTQAALTDEEKQKQAAAFEKRMLDLYVEGGGKIEEFSLLKQVASSDLTELSKSELTKELKAIGITDEAQIAAIQKERYYQLEQAEIDAIEDETEKALAQKKFDYGKAKFESKGKQIKENAEDFLNNLKEAVNQKDFFTKRENEVSANVDEHFSKLEKKMTLQLGKIDDIEIAPVEYEVPQDVIDKARARLNTTASRKELLFNKDGSINHTNLADLVLKAELFESGTAAKTAYLTGADREVEKFSKLFPYRSASALGTGTSQQNNGSTGKVASVGKVQKGQRPVAQQN
jgi:hypothetical protein